MSESPYYTEEHQAFRSVMRSFVNKEIEPYVTEWDEAEGFPRELYKKAANIGLIPLGYPEEFGGTPVDGFYRIIVSEELARAGSGGLIASLMSHGIGLPPIMALGTQALKNRVAPQVLAGEKISALAITEPSGGSDVAAIKTTAKRKGDHYVVNGSKMFITSGLRADYYTVAVRTGGEGRRGISLLLLERGMPGFTQSPIKKMGWWASDTAALYFDNVEVPTENLIGAENEGFLGIMNNFNSERLGMASGCAGFARTCIEEATEYAKIRETFGQPLINNQVIRHKIVDMNMRTNAVKAYLEKLTWRVGQGEKPVAELCMLKNLGSTNLEYVAGEAVQILGGAGYMRGSKSERIFRESKIQSIGGGAIEIMKDLAGKSVV